MAVSSIYPQTNKEKWIASLKFGGILLGVGGLIQLFFIFRNEVLYNDGRHAAEIVSILLVKLLFSIIFFFVILVFPLIISKRFMYSQNPQESLKIPLIVFVLLLALSAWYERDGCMLCGSSSFASMVYSAFLFFVTWLVYRAHLKKYPQQIANNTKPTKKAEVP